MTKAVYNPLIINRQDVDNRNLGHKFVGYLIPFKGEIIPYQSNELVHSMAAREHNLYNSLVVFKDFFDRHEKYSQKELDDVINGCLEFEKGDKLDILVSEYIRDLVKSENGKEKLLLRHYRAQ